MPLPNRSRRPAEASGTGHEAAMAGQSTETKCTAAIGHVLLCEDEEILGQALSRLLARAGLKVTWARRGSFALDLFRNGSFDLVLTDVHMPGLPGIEMAQKIRSIDDATPIIFITGNPEVESAMAAVALRAFEFLKKPVDCGELVDVVFRALGEARRGALAQTNEHEVTGEFGCKRTIGGRYEVMELLGSGGCGSVYSGLDIKSGSPVAIKILRDDVASDPAGLQRFRQEALAVSALEHPNVVKIVEFISEPGRSPALITERLEGETLRQAFARGPMKDWRPLFQYAYDILDALDASHQIGIVHRDIKPGNIFITKGQGAKVLDFGSAKLEGGTRLTRTGRTIGTPAFMAPEQVKGAPVTPLTDVYAVGLLLYIGLGGELPYEGENAFETMYAVLGGKRKPLDRLRPDLPGVVLAVAERAMASEPKVRFGSALKMQRAVEAVLRGTVSLGPARAVAAV